MEDLRALAMDLRSVADRLLAQSGAAPSEPATAATTVLYMTLSAFAAHRNVSLATVKRWRRFGLPCSTAGRVVRVRLADADRWVDSGAATLAIRDLGKGAA